MTKMEEVSFNEIGDARIRAASPEELAARQALNVGDSKPAVAQCLECDARNHFHADSVSAIADVIALVMICPKCSEHRSAPLMTRHALLSVGGRTIQAPRRSCPRRSRPGCFP